ATPEDFGRGAEVRRARVFAGYACSIALAASLLVLFMPGDPVARCVLWVGCGVLLAGGVPWLWRLREPDNYRPSEGAYFGYLAIIAIGGGFLYFGPFSAAAMVVSLGGFMFSLDQSRRAVIIMASLACLMHGAIGGLVAFGVMADRGLVTTRPEGGVAEKLIGLGFIQSITIASFFLGRVVRRATLQRVRQRGDFGRYSGLTIGSFRLGCVLGRGASGEIYEAVHATTQEPAAVKLLQPTALANPQLVKRFLREIELAAAVSSPQLVRVLEVAGPHEPVKYIAMERLRGTSLSAILRESEGLTTAEVIELVEHVARGIAAAHAAKIVHRDLKPSNIVRHQETARRHVWKIVDFGISKLISSHGTLTEGRMVGTPGYMAPEQATGGAIDHRADLYALAAVTYRVLTGRPPFGGPDVASTIYRVVHTMPLRPTRAQPALPGSVDDLLAVGLAKRPEDRFDDALTFAAALRAALAGTVDASLAQRAEDVLAPLPWREHDRRP
ncbi:MAG: serine/threonine protein kinase, partial [Kofleriaceae bacterium]